MAPNRYVEKDMTEFSEVFPKFRAKSCATPLCKIIVPSVSESKLKIFVAGSTNFRMFLSPSVFA